MTEAEVKRSMTLLFEEFKIVAEPGGAAAFAAAWSNRADLVGKSVAIVISGGNVDCERFCELTRVEE